MVSINLPHVCLRARDRLSTVVKPLLEKLCKYTGYSCISLIDSAVEGDKYKIGMVHHGEVQETINKNLASFNPEGFRRDFVGHFFKFPCATKGTRRRLLLSDYR